MLKFLLIIVLLCCPPYGWVALFLWFCFAEAAKTPKKKAEMQKDTPAAPVSSSPAAPADEQTAPVPMAVKVEHETCNIYAVSTGAYIRGVGSHIVQASVSGDFVAAVDRRGDTHIYQVSTGAYMRQLGRHVVNAQIQGDEVALTDKDGRVEIYRVSTGAYLRSL